MAMPNSSVALRQLLFCVALLLVSMVVVGYFLWPIVAEYQWELAARGIRDGQSIDDVVGTLGQPSRKDEYLEHGVDTEQHYWWHKGNTQFKIVVRNGKVAKVEELRTSV